MRTMSTTGSGFKPVVEEGGNTTAPLPQASLLLAEQKHNFAGLSDEPFSHARRRRRRLQARDEAWARQGGTAQGQGVEVDREEMQWVAMLV